MVWVTARNLSQVLKSFPDRLLGENIIADTGLCPVWGAEMVSSAT